jgi:hypothetical protein
MDTQACCSHSKITRITEEHPGGFTSEHWKCDTCETRFAPEPLISGRSLRDWFAGQAMPGLLASLQEEGVNCTLIAQLAYKISDAMIAQREKK